MINTKGTLKCILAVFNQAPQYSLGLISVFVALLFILPGSGQVSPFIIDVANDMVGIGTLGAFLIFTLGQAYIPSFSRSDHVEWGVNAQDLARPARFQVNLRPGDK